MQVILCKIQFGVYDQEIYQADEYGHSKLIAKAPLEVLDKTLVSLCFDKKIDEIYLYGIQDIAAQLAQDINKVEYSLYSDNKIKVEVNKAWNI